MALPLPYTPRALKRKQLSKIQELVLQVQSSRAPGFGPFLTTGQPGTCSPQQPCPTLTLTQPSRDHPVGWACSSALNHHQWLGSPAAETRGQIRMSPAGSASSHDPEFPKRVREQDSAECAERGEKLGKGQHQQQGKPEAKEWIPGAPEGGHNTMMMKMGREQHTVPGSRQVR